MSVRAVLGALQAIAATTVECEPTREFGVEWIPRGRGNEIRGITQAQMDAYSIRTVQVHEKERELARAWSHEHGRAPTSRELLHIANHATLLSRKGKDAGPVDWDALAQLWDATLGGHLAGVAPAVSNARGPDVQGSEHHGGRAPAGPPAREAQERALAKALVLVSGQHPAWTRHDLLKHLALALPPETQQMSPEEARELLLGLAEEALSGRTGEVVCLEAPEWPPLPPSLRRELDGRSVYSRPGVARYTTAAQLTLEERLVAHAQAQGAPRLPGELAARRLGADVTLLEAQLRGRAHNVRTHAAPRGLRLDQAAAVWHVLTSPRTVEVITGPAGTGKTRVLATAASAWDGPVFGTATSQNATNELRAAGVRVAANTTRLIADIQRGRIPPGSLIVADEGSMISITHLAAIAEYAARTGCKLVLAGDQEQLAAVEGGGARLVSPAGPWPTGMSCGSKPSPRRRHSSPSARPGPGDRAAAVHRPGVLLSRLPVGRSGLRDHRALRPGRHRAHRDRASHRHRRPPMAVPGDDPRHRHQPRIRVHHPGPARRPAARLAGRSRARPVRPDPARVRRIPARPGRHRRPGQPGPARADRRACRRPRPRPRRAIRHPDPAVHPGQRRPPGHPPRNLDRRNHRRPRRPLP